MWFTRVSLRNPVFAVMLMAALVVLGLFSLQRLKVDQFPSIDFPVADFSETPHFEIGGEGKTTISVADITVEIQNLRIAGDFASDASYFGGGVLEGTIDTRPLDSLLDDSGEAGAICNTAESLGVTCVPCSDNEPYCLSLKVDSITATEAPLELVEIKGSDCAGCLEGVPADTSAECAPDQPPV